MADLKTPTLTDIVVPSARTMRVFKRVRQDRMTTIEHAMHTSPSVEVYELPFFDAVISADEVSSSAKVQFYVYHTSDASARVLVNGNLTPVSVEKPGEPRRIPFAEALRMAGVEYDDQTHLGDVVTEFWSALFAPPSDQFDETSWGVSPWLERNVGDRRTVGELRPGRGGEWDDLWFQFRPRTSLAWPGVMITIGPPQGVEVQQLDLDTVGLRLLRGSPAELGVMVLLRP